MRNLAQFVTIKDIIPKKDAIIGNKIIFIQEGAILPEEDKWEFLRKRINCNE